MKKIIALVLAAVMLLAFAGCGKKQADSEYVAEKGKLVVGITEFAPMDYKEAGSEEWIGFDADMAKGFAEYIGVDVEFVVIDWGNKIVELKNKSIDCVWNGMTLTDEVKGGMGTSNPYCKNAQVVVVKKDVADKYQTVESIKDLKFAVETESAGQKELEALEYNFTALDDQAAALNEVKAGTSDACVIDLLMAGATIGEGTSYEDLTYTVSLNSEEYGVGFRKESDLADKLNEYFAKTYKDGTMMKLAEKYGVQESIIAQD